MALSNGGDPPPQDPDDPGYGDILRFPKKVPRWVVHPDDDRPIEPRSWLLGTSFCRRYLSSVIAAGGTGKSSLRIAQALALTTQREITGEHVFHRVNVLLLSLEDDLDELRRRVRAGRKHFGIPLEETEGRLFLCSANGLKLATVVDGIVTQGPLMNMIRDAVEEYGISLVSIDPFVKAHGAEENDNNAIDQVVTLLTKLAADLNIAIDCPHHTNKGMNDPGNADKARGASSFKDAARLVYSLNEMSKEDGDAFGIKDEDRRQYVRVDSAKVNIAPKAGAAKWFKLVSVNLDNGNDLYKNGDNVQVIEPWDPPITFADISNTVANKILDEIDAGLENGDRYSNHGKAEGRGAWLAVMKHVPEKTQKQAFNIVKTWIHYGVLVDREYYDQAARKNKKGLYVIAMKRPS